MNKQINIMKMSINKCLLLMIMFLLVSCNKIIKKGAGQCSEKVTCKTIKAGLKIEKPPFFFRLGRFFGIFTAEKGGVRMKRLAKYFPNHYFEKNKSSFGDERELNRFFDLFERSPERLISKINNNPHFLIGWNKMKNTIYYDNIDLVNFFSAKNLKNVSIENVVGGLKIHAKNGEVLGVINMDKRIMRIVTKEPNKTGKVTVKELNPLINQQYVRGTNPKFSQTMLPDFMIDISRKSNKLMLIQTDQLSRPSYYKCRPSLISNPIRNNKEQVMSKHLRDAYDEDEGGHIIAASLGGIAEQLNYLPMSKKINRSGGQFFQFEESVRKALKANKEVFYEVYPSYSRDKLRPDSFRIILNINGISKALNILNI